MIRLYHGGLITDVSGSLWATPDADYAAAFAQLYEGALWMLTVDVNDGEVLDLRGCGLDVAAVATDLTFAGIPARTHAGDDRHPLLVVRRVKPAIQTAGYRLVRLREWIDWGAGERHAEWVLIVDMTTIVDREVVPLPPGRNFQFPDHHPHPRPHGAGLVCPHCDETRGDVVSVQGNHVSFRCDACGHHWTAGEA